MNDSNTTPASETGTPEPQPVSYETALETVRQVVAWYAQQIQAARRSPEPDQARLSSLTAGERAAQDDAAALEDADDTETARIAARYEARFNELTGR